MTKQTYVVIEEGNDKDYKICIFGNVLYRGKKCERRTWLSIKKAKQLHADLGKVLDQIAEEKG